MHARFLAPALSLSLLIGAIASAPAALGQEAAAPAPVRTAPIVVPEAYVSADSPGDELDSLATWRHRNGDTWLIATAKSSHRLVVFDADTGQRLRDVGGKGDGPGQFKRPNGVAVYGDRLFVAERDNRRVQVFALPEFRPLGSFGAEVLKSPYGLWLNPRTRSGSDIEVYITDNFMEGPRYEQVPPLEKLNERVRRYRLRFAADGTFTATPLGSFGETDEAQALRIVESIAGDARRRTLLIADEDTRNESTLREYGLDGRASGRSVPRASFDAEAEGVALWSCPRQRGYWIAVDQLPTLTVFHLFNRSNLSARGSFTGQIAGGTDGIALRTAPTRRFPSGALFAVHRDKAVVAFDLRDVVSVLRLSPDCL